MQPTSQPKKTVPSFGKHIFAIGVALVIVLAVVFMFSSRQGKADLAAQLFPISLGTSVPTTNIPVPLVCKPSSPMAIKVTSPNGGQTFNPGQQVQINWSSCKLSAGTNLNIYLAYYYGGSLAGAALLGSVPSTVTSLQATMPQTASFGPGFFQYGQNYKILVTNGSSATNGSIFDTSDTLFSIINPSQTGIVVSPGNVAPSVQLATGSPHDVVTFQIPFTVTAVGADAYIPQWSMGLATPTTTNKVQFCVDATTPCMAAGVGNVTVTGPTLITPTANGNYKVSQGSSINFDLTVTFQPSAYVVTRASLLNVNWSSSDATASGVWNMYTNNLNTNVYKTPYIAAH